MTETPSESFVVIHSPEHGPGEKMNTKKSSTTTKLDTKSCLSGPVMRPGDGYTWSRQLVFRAKVKFKKILQDYNYLLPS